MHAIIFVAIWLLGWYNFILPEVVRKYEVGYGVVIVGCFAVWTIFVFIMSFII